MNPRVEVKTNEERRADAMAYYYKNRDKILEKKRKERERKQRNTSGEAARSSEIKRYL